MKLLSIITLAVFTLLAGCGTKQPAIKAAPVGSDSLFNVSVEPVTEPQLYRYGPAIGTLTIGTEFEAGRKRQSLALVAKYSILEERDTLIWHIFIPEWTENGKAYRPSASLVDLTMDTDKRGVIGKTEVTFPIVRAYNIKDPEALKAFEQMSLDLGGMTLKLPEGPIVSGDAIADGDIGSFRKVMSDISGNPRHILEGEFTLDGVRYVSMTMDDTVSGKLKANGQEIRITLKARSITRKENMETVYGYADVTGTDPSGKVIVKSRSTYAKSSDDLSH